MTIRRTLLFLSLLAALAGARAQEPAEPNQAAEQAAEEAETDEPRRTREDSPFDYEASEQISEDLSVSFPVDI
ncbi:hypothetical protein [Parahaliea mediterranea]|uniref:Uncharacterized protein n=1 Tax=Parahaliea mediterranea TaxID=651086 RepID=A0A939DCC6_9GAMM|nr:hypothetical protein [Parahaliea mediterranea]MBN7795623.1 hypothetical protein [Parahaliea mediterranea]